jgi:transcription-repair coupling factor (superfamily II helicase)
MDVFKRLLEDNREYKRLSKAVSDGCEVTLTTGVADGQKAHIIYGLAQDKPTAQLVITGSELKAKELVQDLSCFLKNRVCLYPSKDIIFYSADVKSIDIVKNRFEVLARLLNGEPLTVVLSVEALFDKLVMPDVFKNYILKLKTGDSINLEELERKLVFMGYERCDMVEGQGQFAVRGGILDLFSTVSDNAVRIEFWGDEIDSIRILDAVSQRSVENTESVRVYPMRELVYGDDEIKYAIDSLNAELKAYKRAPDRIKEIVAEVVEKLTQYKSFSGVDKYINYFYKDCATLMDYMPKDSLVFIDEPSRVREHSDFVLNEFTQSIENRIDTGYMLPNQLRLVYTYKDILSRLDGTQRVLMTSLIQTIKDFTPKEIIDFKVKGSQVFKNNMDAITEDLSYMCSVGYKVLFLGGGRARCERLEGELKSRDIAARYVDNTDELVPEAGVVYLVKGSLLHGFEYFEDKVAVITDTELQGEEKKQRKRKKKNDKTSINNFAELKVGDYVVHENYGICVFRGVEQIVSDGVNKDYIKLGFHGDDILYVAINQLDILQKYIGGDAAKPKLSKLGTPAWSKAKAKARQAAKILAADLVDLYAQRQTARGHIYSPDTVWQTEFEEVFPYTETEDQLNAIADVKQDMEEGKIMDRLICGDVGFGKTEVALRAAFKTVQEGYQVAYLVPTTILARQHYQTFASRMEEYPVKVDMLSRFRTPKQQRETIKGLESGMSDVVIGTHRLLSKDIKFNKLGLVIVDEEQRFGVSHKEKLKELKKDVNVLTLTATPIPRTLHMSLTGIRDMSVLEEPPSDRLPIQTYVMEYNPEFVKDAIHRELARGGQVYYLHNRVMNIVETANRLQELVPEANVAYAHGQMSERELENVMMEFMDKEIDVLVCTTIIETGLDIPNVNTIIISDADKMGLSQLYQLRGRVGRSTRTSFAYLMYQRDKVLSEVSQKRLKAIREFTEFGSGFRVAMRDLEIRGAGNLLGSEQHGHMDTIGYELYCKLLDEAVRELRGEEVEETFETLMEISVHAFIPTEYIEIEEQKLDMYKKISVIASKEDFYNVQDELEDRYGAIPMSVANLLDIAYIKALLHQRGVTKVSQRKGNVIINFKADAKVDVTELMKSIQSMNNRLMFTANEAGGYLTYKIQKEKEVLKELKELAEMIK